MAAMKKMIDEKKAKSHDHSGGDDETGDRGDDDGKDEDMPCQVCLSFPEHCPTMRYIHCLAHGAGGGNYGTWLANLIFNIFGIFAFLGSLVSAAAMCSSACISVSGLRGQNSSQRVLKCCAGA